MHHARQRAHATMTMLPTHEGLSKEYRGRWVVVGGAAEDMKSTTEHVRIELRSRACTSYLLHSSNYFRLCLEDKKQHLRPSESRLPNTRPTELLVRGATTAITTADPAGPSVSTAGLTLSLATYPRDTALTGGIRTTCNSLRPRSAELSSARKSKRDGLTYPYQQRPKRLNAGPAMPLKA